MTENDILNIKGFTKLNETEELNNIDLKQRIENFKQNHNLFSFTFKHETVDKVEIGDEILPNFHVYFGDVWIQIKENKSYMFISSPNHEEFISDVIKNIIQSKIENLEKEITMEKIDLKDCFADIIALDAIKVSGSWFKKINPQIIQNDGDLNNITNMGWYKIVYNPSADKKIASNVPEGILASCWM